MTNTLAVLSAAVGLLMMIIGGGALWHQIRTASKADRERAEEKLNARIDKAVERARESERGRCNDLVARVRDERDQAKAYLAEMTVDRNVERARADTLQNLINERGLGDRPR